MKKIINYEKDIIFKTNIGSITSISLEHDFTVDDRKLVGDFIVSGDYKLSELSVNKETFNYRLPLMYELEDNVDLTSLTYDVENFEYKFKDDVLTVFIDFAVKYDELEMEPIIPPAKEINIDDLILKGTLDEEDDRVVEPKEVEVEEIKEEAKEDRLDEEEKNTILNNVTDDDVYVKYHVHIVRDGENLESIASMYNVTTDLIKEYNSCDTLNTLDELIIPEYNE